MDRNFARSLALVLKSEGGWSDNPKDPGGPTMKGVTLKNFRRYVKADATKDDLRHITDAQVATVYRRHYWDAVAGAELPDGVDYAVFDFGVNSGQARAIQFLQRIVKVNPDKRIGPVTVKAAGAKPAADVINGLCDARLVFLKTLKTWPTFGTGWSSRVRSVRTQALSMAVQPPSVPVVIQKAKEDDPVVATIVTAPPSPPSIPKSKTGWGLLAGILAAIAAVLAKLHFGG